LSRIPFLNTATYISLIQADENYWSLPATVAGTAAPKRAARKKLLPTLEGSETADIPSVASAASDGEETELDEDDSPVPAASSVAAAGPTPRRASKRLSREEPEVDALENPEATKRRKPATGATSSVARRAFKATASAEEDMGPHSGNFCCLVILNAYSFSSTDMQNLYS
jgi:hypothetical protein